MSILLQLKKFFFFKKKEKPWELLNYHIPFMFEWERCKGVDSRFRSTGCYCRGDFFLLVPNYCQDWRRVGGDIEVSLKKSKQHPKCFHNIRGSLNQQKECRFCVSSEFKSQNSYILVRCPWTYHLLLINGRTFFKVIFFNLCKKLLKQWHIVILSELVLGR